MDSGGLIAHNTGTLPGVAASLNSPAALGRLKQFKQRQGPFLLLADSRSTALSLARYRTPELRRQARACWPGPVTLVFAAKPGLPACCYERGHLAVRVDASLQTRQLARSCGGVILSSSLNRRGGSIASSNLRDAMRLHRWLNLSLAGAAGSGSASAIVRTGRNHSTIIRR